MECVEKTKGMLFTFAIFREFGGLLSCPITKLTVFKRADFVGTIHSFAQFLQHQSFISFRSSIFFHNTVQSLQFRQFRYTPVLSELIRHTSRRSAIRVDYFHRGTTMITESLYSKSACRFNFAIV